MTGRRWLVQVVAAALGLAGSAAADTTFVAAGSTWRYLDDGSDQGTAWRASGFADGSWSSGPAQLGYGDGDEATTLGYGGDSNNKYVTYYFRTTFTVADPALYIDQTLRLLRDDGAIVYLNGTEVRRDNMPTGTVDYHTFASVALGGTDESTFFETTIPADALVAGTNTLAVEIHQANATSSDISFDLELVGRLGSSFIQSGATWRYLDDGSDQGTAWRAPGFADGSWASGPAQLGYGDGDEATTLGYGGDANNKYTTYYFRRTFTVADPSAYIDQTLRLLRDDGAIVYLNGTEVRRDNMPAGAVDYQTFASTALGGADESTFFDTTISAAALVAGTNTLAVEIHQANLTSSDISFDLELTGRIGTGLISSGAMWRYLDDGSDQGTAWRALGFADGPWASGPAKLGYGDADNATTLGYGGDANNKYVTYYFRRAVWVTNAAAVAAVRVRLLRDDGAIVYVNGTEVRRDNMPTGTVDYLTYADVTVGGADETTFYESVVPVSGLFVTGSNVVAVEIHQAAPNSSDIGFDMEMEALATSEVQVTRGPYLQMGSPSGMVVRWRTDLPTDGVVQYGSDPTNLSSAVMQATVTTEHEVSIGGLEPETKYFYGIGYGAQLLAGAASNYFFVTHPLPGAQRDFRVWVLGDSGTKDQNARNVRDAFHAWASNAPPDLWLMLGDNAYSDGTDAEFQLAIFQMYTNTLLHSVLWPTLGNHDGHSADSASQTGPYYDIFTLPRNGEAGGLASGTEAYYSFDYAQVHFICLDSYETDRSTNGAMLTWMQNDLGSTTQSWIVAFWHHPPYSKGSHNSDTETELKEMRQNALPILEAAGVDLVLGGHSHAYERSYLLHGHYGLSTTLTNSMIANGGDGREDGDGSYDKTLTNGAVYTVAGSSGQTSGGSLNHPAMYLSLNQLGSVALDVSERTITARFIDDAGNVQDWFTLRKDTPVYVLNALASGRGDVAPSAGAYLSNTVVQVAATPSNFFVFGQWTGDVTGTVNPTGVVMDSDKQITAVFDPILVTNGVPQWWLFEHGLGTNDADALADQDDDKVFTWAEYVADTDPMASGSFLRIDTLWNEGGAAVSFDASTARVYTLQYLDDTLAEGWSNVSSAVRVEPTNSPHTLLDPETSTSRAYRVEVDLP